MIWSNISNAVWPAHFCCPFYWWQYFACFIVCLVKVRVFGTFICPSLLSFLITDCAAFFPEWPLRSPARTDAMDPGLLCMAAFVFPANVWKPRMFTCTSLLTAAAVYALVYAAFISGTRAGPFLCAFFIICAGILYTPALFLLIPFVISFIRMVKLSGKDVVAFWAEW